MTGRSCDSCEKYVYDDGPDYLGPLTLHRGEPLLRDPRSSTPCYHCPKIPRGCPKHRDFAIELSARNWQVYQHYKICKVIGWTARERADGLVRLHAGILGNIEDGFYLGGPRQSLQMIGKILLALVSKP